MTFLKVLHDDERGDVNEIVSLYGYHPQECGDGWFSRAHCGSDD